MSREVNLDQMGEFGLIKSIQKKFSHLPPPWGIGDDAAVLRVPRRGRTPRRGRAPHGHYLLATTDALIEGVHFKFSTSHFSHIGYKAVMVNLSDIAAMGGTPRAYLVSLALTPKQTLRQITQLYTGMKKAGDAAGIDLIGGNTTRSSGGVFVSLTLFGEVKKENLILRRGARVGDALYVTGVLGDAAAGVELLNQGDGGYPVLTCRARTPTARWREGPLLAKSHLVSAMIDLSDGLSSDLIHLTTQSGVGARLDLSLIPMSPSLIRYAKRTQRDPLSYALHGGEDYELLFCVRQRNIAGLNRLIQRGTLHATRIGAIVAPEKGITTQDRDGQVEQLTPKGFDHFFNPDYALEK